MREKNPHNKATDDSVWLRRTKWRPNPRIKSPKSRDRPWKKKKNNCTKIKPNFNLMVNYISSCGLSLSTRSSEVRTAKQRTRMYRRLRARKINSKSDPQRKKKSRTPKMYFVTTGARIIILERSRNHRWLSVTLRRPNALSAAAAHKNAHIRKKKTTLTDLCHCGGFGYRSGESGLETVLRYNF